VSFAAITVCVCFSTSVCYCYCLFRYDSVQKLLDTLSYLSNIRFNSILPSLSRSSKWLFSVRFSNQAFVLFASQIRSVLTRTV
jgi:hypothetical protein